MAGSFTRSVDAALPGEDIVAMTKIGGRYIALARGTDRSCHEGRSSANEAIARRIAALRARAALSGKAGQPSPSRAEERG
jgi:hypothetical protein